MTQRIDATRRTAFTLLEMMIVVLILALMAGMMVPRLSGSARRSLRFAGDQVTDLLTMYAQRESLSQKPIGLAYDPERNWLTVLVLDRDDPRDVGGGEWRLDHYVKPVKLPPHITLFEVYADDVPTDITEIPLSHTPGKQRPAIQIVLQGREETLSLVLDSYAVTPRRLDSDTYASGIRVQVDLDAAGLDREDW